MTGLRCRAGHPPDDGALSPLAARENGTAADTPRAGDETAVRVLKSPSMLHPDEQAHQFTTSVSASASPKPAPRGGLCDAIRGLQMQMHQHHARDLPFSGRLPAHLDFDPLERSSFAVPPRSLDFAALADEAWERAALDDADGSDEACCDAAADGRGDIHHLDSSREERGGSVLGTPAVEVLGFLDDRAGGTGSEGDGVDTDDGEETPRGEEVAPLSPPAAAPRLPAASLRTSVTPSFETAAEGVASTARLDRPTSISSSASPDSTNAHSVVASVPTGFGAAGRRPAAVPPACAAAGPGSPPTSNAAAAPSFRSGASASASTSPDAKASVAAESPSGRLSTARGGRSSSHARRTSLPPHARRPLSHAADPASPSVDLWQSMESRASRLPARHRPLELLFGFGHDVSPEKDPTPASGRDEAEAEVERGVEEEEASGEGDEVFRAMLPSNLCSEVDASDAYDARERGFSDKSTSHACAGGGSERSGGAGAGRGAGRSEDADAIERWEQSEDAGAAGDADESAPGATRGACHDDGAPLRSADEDCLEGRAALNPRFFDSPQARLSRAIPPNSPATQAVSPLRQAHGSRRGSSPARPQSLFAAFWFAEGPAHGTVVRSGERPDGSKELDACSPARREATAWEQDEAGGPGALARSSFFRKPAGLAAAGESDRGGVDEERIDSPHESALTPLSQPMLTPQSGVRRGDAELQGREEPEATSVPAAEEEQQHEETPPTLDGDIADGPPAEMEGTDRSDTGPAPGATPRAQADGSSAVDRESAPLAVELSTAPRASPSFHTALDTVPRNASLAESYSSRPAPVSASRSSLDALGGAPRKTAAGAGAWSQTFVGAFDETLDDGIFGVAEDAGAAGVAGGDVAETSERAAANGVASRSDGGSAAGTPTGSAVGADATVDAFDPAEDLSEESSEQESISGDVSSDESESCDDEERGIEAGGGVVSVRRLSARPDDRPAGNAADGVPLAPDAVASRAPDSFASADEGSDDGEDRGYADEASETDVSSPLPPRRSAVRPRMLFGESMDELIASDTGEFCTAPIRVAFGGHRAAAAELPLAFAPRTLSTESSDYVTAAPTRAASTVSPPASRPTSADVREVAVGASTICEPVHEEREEEEAEGEERGVDGGEEEGSDAGGVTGENAEAAAAAEALPRGDGRDDTDPGVSVRHEGGPERGGTDRGDVVDEPGHLADASEGESAPARRASQDMRRLCKVAEKLERFSLAASDQAGASEGSAPNLVPEQEIVACSSSTDGGVGSGLNDAARRPSFEEVDPTPFEGPRLSPRLVARASTPRSGPRSARREASAEQAELALHQASTALDQAKNALSQAEDALEKVRREEFSEANDEEAPGEDRGTIMEEAADDTHREQHRGPAPDDTRTASLCGSAALSRSGLSASESSLPLPSDAASEPVSHGVSPPRSSAVRPFASPPRSPSATLQASQPVSSLPSPLSSPPSVFASPSVSRGRVLKRSSKFARQPTFSTAAAGRHARFLARAPGAATATESPLQAESMVTALENPASDEERSEGAAAHQRRDVEEPQDSTAESGDGRVDNAVVMGSLEQHERDGGGVVCAVEAEAGGSDVDGDAEAEAGGSDVDGDAEAGEDHGDGGGASEAVELVLHDDCAVAAEEPSSPQVRLLASPIDASETTAYASPLPASRTAAVGEASSSLAVSNEATFALGESIACDRSDSDAREPSGSDALRPTHPRRFRCPTSAMGSESCEATSTPHKSLGLTALQSVETSQRFQTPLSRDNVSATDAGGAMQSDSLSEVSQRPQPLVLLSLSIPEHPDDDDDDDDARDSTTDQDIASPTGDLNGAEQETLPATQCEAGVGVEQSSAGEAAEMPHAPETATDGFIGGQRPVGSEDDDDEAVMEDVEETSEGSVLSDGESVGEASPADAAASARSAAPLLSARQPYGDRARPERAPRCPPLSTAAAPSPVVRLLSAETSAPGCPTDRSSVFSNPIFEDDASRAEEEGVASSRPSWGRDTVTPDGRILVRGLHSLGSRDTHRGFRDFPTDLDATRTSNRLSSLPPPTRGDIGDAPGTDRAQGHRFMRSGLVVPSLQLPHSSRMPSQDSVPTIGDLCSPSPDPIPSAETSAGWGAAHHGAGCAAALVSGGVPVLSSRSSVPRPGAPSHTFGRRLTALPSAESIGPLLFRAASGSGQLSEPSTGRAALEVLDKGSERATPGGASESLSNAGATSRSAFPPAPDDVARVHRSTAAWPAPENSAEWACAVVDAREEAERLAMDAGQIVDASRSISREPSAFQVASARPRGPRLANPSTTPPRLIAASPLPEGETSQTSTRYATPEAFSRPASRLPSSVSEVLAELPPVPTSVPAPQETATAAQIPNMPDVPSGSPHVSRRQSPRMVEVELASGEVMLAPLAEESGSDDDDADASGAEIEEDAEQRVAGERPAGDQSLAALPTSAADDQVLGALMTIDSAAVDLSALCANASSPAGAGTRGVAVDGGSAVSAPAADRQSASAPDMALDGSLGDVTTAPPSSQGLFESPAGKGTRSEGVARASSPLLASPAQQGEAVAVDGSGPQADAESAPAGFDAAEMARAAERLARPLGPMARAAAAFKPAISRGAFGSAMLMRDLSGRRTGAVSKPAGGAASAAGDPAVAARNGAGARVAAIAAKAPAAATIPVASASLGSLGPGPLSTAAAGVAPPALAGRPSEGLVESFAPPLGAAIAEREMRSRYLRRGAGSLAPATRSLSMQHGRERTDDRSSLRPLGANVQAVQLRSLSLSDVQGSRRGRPCELVHTQGSRSLRHLETQERGSLQAGEPRAQRSLRPDEPQVRHALVGEKPTEHLSSPGGAEDAVEANAALDAMNARRFSAERSVSFAHASSVEAKGRGIRDGTSVRERGVQATQVDAESDPAAGAGRGAKVVRAAATQTCESPKGGVELHATPRPEMEPAVASELQSESFVTAMETPCSKVVPPEEKRRLSTSYPSIDVSTRLELDDPSGDAERRFAEKVRMAQRAHREDQLASEERVSIGAVRSDQSDSTRRGHVGYPTVDYDISRSPSAAKAAVKKTLGKPGRFSTCPEPGPHSAGLLSASTAPLAPSASTAPPSAFVDASASFAPSSLGPDVSAAPHDLRAAVAAAVAPLVQRIALLEDELEAARGEAARASIRTERLDSAEIELEAARVVLAKTRRDVLNSFTRGTRPGASAGWIQEQRTVHQGELPSSDAGAVASPRAAVQLDRAWLTARAQANGDAVRSPDVRRAASPPPPPLPKPAGSWAGGLPIPTRDDWEARLASKDDPEDEPLPSWVVKAFAERGAYGEGPSSDWAVLSSDRAQRDGAAESGAHELLWSPQGAHKGDVMTTRRRRETSAPAPDPRAGRGLDEPYPADFYPTVAGPAAPYQRSSRSQNASPQDPRRAPPIFRAHWSLHGARDGADRARPTGYDRRNLQPWRPEEWHGHADYDRFEGAPPPQRYSARSRDYTAAAPRLYDREAAVPTAPYGSYDTTLPRRPGGPAYDEGSGRQCGSLSPREHAAFKRGFRDPFPSSEDSLRSGRIPAHRRAAPPLDAAESSRGAPPPALSPRERAEFRASWEASEEAARKRRVNRRPVGAEFVPLSAAAPLLGRRHE